LFVADETHSAVSVVEIRSGKVVKTFSLPGPPTGLPVNKAAGRLFLTLGHPSNSVQILKLPEGTLEASIVAGHPPGAPVLSADASTLYVCNRLQNDVSVIDLARKQVVKRIPAVREPLAAALTPDGKTLIVGNARPDGPATASRVSSSVTVIDAERMEVLSNV